LTSCFIVLSLKHRLARQKAEKDDKIDIPTGAAKAPEEVDFFPILHDWKDQADGPHPKGPGQKAARRAKISLK
jgi:hypothetical protein